MAVGVDSVIVELEARVAKYNADVNSAAANFDRKATQIGASASRMERKTSLAFSALKAGAASFLGALSVGAFVRITKAGLEYAASLGEVAQSLGVGTKFLQEFRFAAQQNGASLEAADSALGKFSITLGKALSGDQSAVDSFTALGISIKQLNAASEQQRFELVADGIKKIADPARQSAAAIEIFGRGARDIIPTLLSGADGFRQQAAEAAKYGLILSDSQIQNADKTADKIDALTQALQAKIAGVVADNAQQIGALANALSDLASEAIKAAAAWLAFQRAQARTAQIRDENRGAEVVADLGPFGQVKRNTKRPLPKGGRGGGRAPVGSEFRNAADAPDPSSNLPIPGRGDITPVKTPKGPKGTDPAKDAARAAEAAARDQEAIQRELFSASSAELRARQDISTSATERLTIEHQLLDMETAERKSEIESDAAQRKKEFPLKAAQIDAETQKLLLLNDQIDQERRAKIDRDEEQRLAQDALDIRTADIESQRDLLSSQADLSVTIKDRRDIELKLLDLQYEEAQLRLEAVIASKTATDAEKKIAQARLDLLGALKASDAQRVNNANLSPLDAFRKRLSDESKDVNASIEDAEVRAFGRLEDSLTNSVKQALHLHGVFGDLIGDLIQIAIRQLVIKQIVDAINSSEGSGGGGGGGFFSKLLSIGSSLASASGGGKSISNKAKASGGAVSAGELVRVNEAGVEGFRPAQSGTIIPLGQMPNAASPSFDRQPVIVQLAVHEGAMFEPRVQAISGDVSVRVVRASAPTLIDASVSETFRRGGRPRL